jgi:hypothetical protein
MGAVAQLVQRNDHVSPTRTSYTKFFVIDNLDELGEELESLAVGELVLLGWF